MKLNLVLLFIISGVSAHGRLRYPASRSSAWRDGFKTPINYNDNQLFCGGKMTQWQINGGKCGICGDPWNELEPRDNELGGKYGTGLITATYKRGQVIETWVEITANHLGHFVFRICPLKNLTTDATQDCLDKYVLQRADGNGTVINVLPNQMNFFVPMKLPDDLTCNHCTLQWDYVTGNSWGTCPDGHGALGCGPQETFRGCADISIEP